MTWFIIDIQDRFPDKTKEIQPLCYFIHGEEREEWIHVFSMINTKGTQSITPIRVTAWEKKKKKKKEKMG